MKPQERVEMLQQLKALEHMNPSERRKFFEEVEDEQDDPVEALQQWNRMSKQEQMKEIENLRKENPQLKELTPSMYTQLLEQEIINQKRRGNSEKKQGQKEQSDAIRIRR